MRIFKPNSELSKYYSFIFRLPGYYVVILLIISVNLLFFVHIGYNILIYIIYFILVFLTVSVYGLLSNSPYKRLKRSLFLALMTETYAFIIGFFDVGLGIVSSTVMIIIGLLGVDGTSIRKYILSIIPPLLVLLVFNMYNYILLLLVPILLDYIIYKIMSTHKIGRYPAPDIGSMFVRNILERKRDIEKVFEDLGEEEIVNPRIIYNDNELFMLYSDIHYGPFSNTGSSMLPTLLYEKLKNKYSSVVVLHGMGSHDRNISTFKETIRFIDYIIKNIDDTNSEHIKFHGYERISDGEWDLLLLVFNKLSMIFVSRSEGIDDLPYELQKEYELKAAQAGLGDLILIDCHNHELESKPNIDALRKLLDKAIDRISEIKADNNEKTLIYRAKTIKIRSPGVIGSNIILIQLGDKPEKLLSLIYISGNNMEPGLREKIRKVLSEKYGIDQKSIEVFTNDEHTETGIYASTIYIPVQYNDKLLTAILEGYKDLLGKEFKKDLKYKKLSIKTKLMKNTAWKLLELVHKPFKLSLILVWSYILLTPFVLFLIKELFII
ncbi:DUF2070 family protein [Staphylothermus hellenicus]|uniref:Membrane protein-like protein n=1 Tax=Staphylothermus hellenicus (strain DSM 12710 / JCM 10830 / BK20S6-10-b1 / P8) TaxID=591019 RepID=D7D8Y4_STAHD|nr:DUF2070 family protein [Staphylothermus hellenicus]ADI32230.1 membrane protein-like protein [Staphylothermus hellenicus DSM 12710]